MPTKPHAPLQTVAYVDLKRYTGRWYEFARYANSFEKKCASDAQAEYTILSGTKVQVRNVCRTKEGKWKESKGWGKVVDPATNAKLRVTFFWPFFGDYWVIGLDPQYRWALVGEPNRRYLWVLTREPAIDNESYRRIAETAEKQGYDAGRLIRTPQDQGQKAAAR